MVRLDSDHVNWVLVVILVALALLLAMVSSTGYGTVHQSDSQAAIRTDQATQFWRMAAQDRKEVRTPSELWYIGCELYRAGRIADARELFELVVAAWPRDPAARMWAGMAAHRAGDAAQAARHWHAACDEEGCTPELGIWPAVALAAGYLRSGRPDDAARCVLPLERGDLGPDPADHPVGSFYAALAYEQLARAAPQFRDAVEESLAEKFSVALASSDGVRQAVSLTGRQSKSSQPRRADADVQLLVSPNSRSWLTFLTKRALQRTIRGARAVDGTAPVVPESATVEPSLVPTVEELLECLGSADFASQARRKLRALELYESPPDRMIDIFDDPELFKRGRCTA